MLNRASRPGWASQVHVPWVCEHQLQEQSARLTLAVPGSPEETLKRVAPELTGHMAHDLSCSECGWGGARSRTHLLQQPLLLVNKRAHRRICAPVTQGHHLQSRCSQLWWGVWGAQERLLAGAFVGKGHICISSHTICGWCALWQCPNWLL